MKKAAFTIILLFAIPLCVEALAWAGLHLWKETKGVEYPGDFRLSDLQIEQIELAAKGHTWNRKWDADLGWTMTPGFNKRGQTVNSDGLCSAREYSLDKPPAALRIAAFGDSNTEAADVTTEDSWPTVLERRIAGAEVLNFGVGGYGPDQCLMRYRHQGKRYNPDIVLICFLTENINRVVNTFRPFYTGQKGLPFTKPYFTLVENSLRLNPNPIQVQDDLLKLKDPDFVRTLGIDDFWYRYRYGSPFIPRWARRCSIVRFLLTASYQLRLQASDKWNPLLTDNQYDRTTDAYKILLGIIMDFYREVEQDGAQPIVFIQVPPDQLNHWRERRHRVHEVLLEDLDSLGIQYVDHAAGLDTIGAQYGIDELYHGHPSELGNQLEAELIIRKLLQLDLVDPDQTRASGTLLKN